MDFLDNKVSFCGPVVATVGFFDGVHRGHQHLVHQVVDLAHAKGMESVVITFDKHPRQAVISGGTNDIAQNDGRYVSNEEIRDNIAAMAAEASAKGIRVVLTSVTPSKGFTWSFSVSHPEVTIVELNKLIKALADEKGYAYADYHSALADAGGGLPSALSSDGTHPNKDGYTIMEGVILPILQACPSAD